MQRLSVFPDDLLLLIFDALASGDPIPWPDASYDQDRAQVPFKLSAICRHWRQISRSKSSLWTYFGSPSDPVPALHRAHLNRLRLIQTLSKNQPLDVVFHTNVYHDLENDDNARWRYRAQIVDLLNGVALRWRSAALRLPHSLASRMDSAMRGDCPHLIFLSIWFKHGMKSLPRAPRLTHLYLECYSLRLANHEVGTYVPSLTSLATQSSNPTIHEKLITASCAGLLDLHILERFWNTTMTPFELPCLKSLTLNDGEFMPFINAPQLQQLALNCGGLHSRLAPAAAHFSRIKHLILYGRIDHISADVLAEFSFIDSLTLDTPPVVRWGLNYERPQIHRFFFSKLVDHVPLVWPMLEHIRLGNLDFENYCWTTKKLGSDMGVAGLISFLHGRMSVEHLTHGTDQLVQPVNLRTIELCPSQAGMSGFELLWTLKKGVV
ncbi:hypothetical protein BKA62DRAFT_232964 [Auriculariales sp. MPI-PUGE-AT-0066]|nr:hypothetical protein BKA62DRAFT_232964 [Auriculariales sp. MPI-PUGE-AT-0066]